MKLTIMVMQQHPETPYTLSDLSERTGASPFSLSKLLTKMVRRGITARGKDGQVSTFTLVDPAVKVVQ
jgi:DNA-binding IscR family transcriptional regulator